MNVAYVNPFVIAVTNVLTQMVNVPATLGRPFVKSANDPQFTTSVIIYLRGSVVGSVTLRFSTEAAMGMASGLIGKPSKFVDAECLDAIGEIANMVVGSAKQHLSDNLTSISTPHLLTGVQHPPKDPDGPTLVLPYESEVGTFALEVMLRPSNARAA